MEKVEIFVDNMDIVHIGHCDTMVRAGTCEGCSLLDGVEQEDGHKSLCVILPPGSECVGTVNTEDFQGEVYLAPNYSGCQ
ncbi:MAG: hypothetical protein OEV28_06115 [Nitrospirota bacterium]|nr:hypothetical protein [Nitrospirota bacterium]